jgi:hypothetical protein
MKSSLLSLAFVLGAASSFAAAPVDYVREVKPILAENCYRCHGASQQKHGLRLDTAAFALKGGETGPAFKPGQSTVSLMIQAVKGTHPDISQMPYKKPPLSAAQIALIELWIDQGASAPANEAPEPSLHWSFVPPVRVPPPAVKQTGWTHNAIDNFLLARLEKEGVSPSPEADRVTLIRRVSLDLTGLPPTIAEVDEFVKDPSPGAYEQLVDRLLASPHYGERWGRHWLDVARYADSNGYSIDAPRSIWKFRDWVIKALNRDLPFDQFVIDQLAGDLRPDATIEQKIATGFHRNTQINQEGGIDPEQFRVESVLDRVNTTGTAFLGLTIGCAQCHDHKFDPISQREYYQLYAFFNNTVEDGHGKSAPEGMLEVPGETETPESAQKELEEAEGDLDRYLNTQGSVVTKWEQSLTPEETAKLRPDVRAALKVAFAERNIKQKRAVYTAYHPGDPEFKQRITKLTALERQQPKSVKTLVMVERKEPRESFIFIKGDFTRKGPGVTPGVLGILHPLQPFPAGEGGQSSNSAPRQFNRLDLARWIVDPKNPLTARVMVNRIWQQYFGRGLVETENDFGTQGSPPSHPALLDWLASEFMNPSTGRREGAPPLAPVITPSETKDGQSLVTSAATTTGPWSLKHIHRLIVNSAAYRQSSRVRPELANSDPNNKLLARQSRLRLDAEIVRDVGLTASGLLNDRLGGPSVFPPQPNGVMTLGQSKRDWSASAGADRYRRGLYTFFWRATPHPALMVFDSSDGFSACTRRVRSNTPLQALTLLNDDAFYEFAQGLAARVLNEGPKEDAARLDLAFRLCLTRPPAPDEKQRLLDLLRHQLATLERSPDEAGTLVSRKSDAKTDVKQLAAWTMVSRVLLNLDEAITRE